MGINKIDVQEVNLGTATTYRAASVIGFYNPEGAAPYLSITEITKGLPESMRTPENMSARNITVPVDVSISVPIYNPITGAATGNSSSIADLLALTYSLYIYAREYAASTAQ